ncbi:MAG: hypothetical protein Q4B31_04300 [Clostridia bacterium]|nr:hypothetical protein [Clostridia bacterium]
MKKKTVLFGLATVAATAAYRIVKGHGVYNRVKYPKEHKAVDGYLKTHRPYSTYSSIEYADGMYSTIITDGEKKFLLTFTLSEEGQFIFTEQEI